MEVDTWQLVAEKRGAKIRENLRLGKYYLYQMFTTCFVEFDTLGQLTEFRCYADKNIPYWDYDGITVINTNNPYHISAWENFIKLFGVEDVTALEFLKERIRMCSEDTKAFYKLEHLGTPEQMIEFIIDWSINHPKKTRLQDFLEKYPNAELLPNGIPKVCAMSVGYGELCNLSRGISEFPNCLACWNKPLEE